MKVIKTLFGIIITVASTSGFLKIINGIQEPTLEKNRYPIEAYSIMTNIQ
jgi:hypothetical protein